MKLLSLVTALVMTAPPETPVRPDTRAGIVYVVQGIGGLSVWGSTAKSALRQAKLPHEVREFRWTHGPGKFLKDLQDTGHHQAKAAELADEIRKLREEDAERPIYLVAHSAGTGLVLRAVESLPAGSVERLILLSSAVSPQYDLRPALAATRREIVSYHSPHDRMMLEWGTKKFGTVDRVYSAGAGLNGFQTPTDANANDKALYDRLVQVPWSQRMLRCGHLGQHNGPCSPAFMLNELSQWLK